MDMEQSNRSPIILTPDAVEAEILTDRKINDKKMKVYTFFLIRSKINSK
jgi:pyridoxal/pyridoxine/pyridoxamine kinase